MIQLTEQLSMPMSKFVGIAPSPEGGTLVITISGTFRILESYAATSHRVYGEEAPNDR